MNKKRQIPIIKLGDEGMLLQCTTDFVCRPVRKPINPQTGRGVIFPHFTDWPMVSEGDIVMFLGCRHSRSKVNEMKAQMVVGHTVRKAGKFREKLREELFEPNWYTSLHFLHKEKIVKVDWHGKCGLDQLVEASHFMYLHFHVPPKLDKAGE